MRLFLNIDLQNRFESGSKLYELSNFGRWGGLFVSVYGQSTTRRSHAFSPLSGQGACSGARTRDERIPADLRADSPSTVPPRPQGEEEKNNDVF
ncbi:hypothetical protein PoB_003817200 [Plakobranchus ocellatus]|uniref:Uncharacterized protein n=1 Tax=Plakobranchus ocellatus TaxID=259542 RepID=A0AAV4AX85_9GAST|nr:hypothetical protein PoB_003817200 [Plakobranchus ocellatus]